MSLEEIEQILYIKNIPNVDQLDEIKQVYMAMAPQVARYKEAWRKLQASVEVSGLTRGWIQATNYEPRLIQNEKEDEEMEDEWATAQEVYTRIAPIMENILSGDDDIKLHLEILDPNKAIAWNWVSWLKPLPEAPKPLAFGGDGTAPTGTAPAGVAVGGITDYGTRRGEIGTELYELTNSNARKPGFTENGEMIMGHNVKYFRKGDKKGQAYSGKNLINISPGAGAYMSKSDYIEPNFTQSFSNSKYVKPHAIKAK
ncbi:hypothetical protein IFR04_012312 [Cadophora malorum]|uniref:Uncharacterized protein n=1 Tax=Cadophora malorum TaxID=108018 RepID=A0A8H7T6Y3_9HELO|nr:hypothetical protein IFR04_012312 [Cadophora malorum]